jgi:hypothetical protein
MRQPLAKKLSFVILSMTLVTYSLLYIATRKDPPCENECPALREIMTILFKTHPYVYNVSRCESRPTGFCVVVRPDPGVDWAHVADTTCYLAKERNLYVTQVFILQNGTFPYDTLAKVNCP